MQGKVKSKAAIVKAYACRLRDIVKIQDYDAIWVQYELFPYLPLIDRIFPMLCSKPIIYDIDDAIFHMYDSHPSKIVRFLLGGKLRPLMRRSSVCLCGNEYLRDYVLKAGGRAIIVPTVVDTDVLRPRSFPTDAPVTVGWIGSPSTWGYVEPLLPTLLPALARLNVRFHVIGAGPAASGIQGITSIDWDEAREAEDIQAMDIGLMPLQDELWARGKCGYKLIQYMACGLPVIASPVGVNATLVEHGKNGFVARSEQEWEEAIRIFAGNADMRRGMGEKGRAKIIESYSLQSQQPIILATLRNAVKSDFMEIL